MKHNASLTLTTLFRIRAYLVLAIGLTGLAIGGPAAWAQAPVVAGPAATPMGTAFTYQGQLIAGGTPVNGDCDFRFRLLDAQTGGAQVGTTQDKEDITVTGGLFTIPNLDFGSGIFTGEARWLEVAVSCAQGVVHTTVGLPQQLTPTPYALHAGRASFASTALWGGLIGVPAGFADDVDNDTQYTTDDTLSLTGTQFSIAPTYRLPQDCDTTNDIARWDDPSKIWVCSQDEGDITGVIAGAGLTGTAFSGEVTIDAQFGGTGSSTYIARSDHNHWGAAWSGSGTGLSLTGGTTGIRADGSTADLDLGGSTGTIVADDSTGADLHLLSNDEVEVHLDNNNDSTSSFTVFNGANTSVFSVDENGKMTFGSWAARTSYLSVPPSAFDGEDNSATLIEEDGSFRPASTGGGIYRAPLYLPHGATVTRLTWYWGDGDDGNATCTLYRSSIGHSWEYAMAAASTSGSAGEPLSSTDATIVDATVDNASNKYYLTLDFPDTLYYYYGAVIEYTTTEPH